MQPTAHWCVSLKRSYRVGQAVKPAMDDEHQLMIPLQNTSRASGDDVTVALVYMLPFVEGNQLRNRGKFTIPLAPAVAGVPINHLCVTLYLPADYRYGEFKGNMAEKHTFSLAPVASNYSRAASRKGGRGGRRMEKRKVRPDMRMARAKRRYDEFDEFQELGGYGGDYLPTYSGAAGIVPLQSVEIPTTGTRFLFERLLVMEEATMVRVPYRERTKGFFAQRRLGFC
jgi:hypothetical protein